MHSRRISFRSAIMPLVTDKRPSGFVPIPFRVAGRVLLPFALALVVVGGAGTLAKWGTMMTPIFFIGLGLLVLSIYLRFVVPKE